MATISVRPATALTGGIVGCRSGGTTTPASRSQSTAPHSASRRYHVWSRCANCVPVMSIAQRWARTAKTASAPYSSDWSCVREFRQKRTEEVQYRRRLIGKVKCACDPFDTCAVHAKCVYAACDVCVACSV